MALVIQSTKEVEEFFIILLKTFIFGKHFFYYYVHYLHVVIRVAIFSKP
jgi:hypothetical protein